jgi:LytS/YehU family sensor histidine kinase
MKAIIVLFALVACAASPSPIAESSAPHSFRAEVSGTGPALILILHVPPLLVQSLVENGVKHGIEQVPAGGTIHVTSWREAGALKIRISNPGRIAPRTESTRIGLANTRERLRLLYTSAATVTLREERTMVVADVSIPIGDA